MSGRQNNSRRGDRKPARTSAAIVFDGSPKPLACVIFNISEGGARVAVAHAKAVPDVFRLILTRDGKTTKFCRVMWRDPPHLGVKFIDPSEADEPARNVSAANPYRSVPLAHPSRSGSYANVHRSKRRGAVREHGL